MTKDIVGMIDALTAPDGAGFGRDFEAALRALADALLEASADDRLFALEKLARMAQRMRYARAYVDDSLAEEAERSGYVRQMSTTLRVSETRAESQGRLLAGMGQSLLPELERGRWFAVRLDAQVARPIYYDAPLELRATATVVPLDGGRVTPGGGG